MKMIQRKMIVIIDAVLVAVNGSAFVLKRLKEYPHRALESAQLDVWGQKWISLNERATRLVKLYFYNVRNAMRYRAYYLYIKKQLKDRYEHIRKHH
jgi:hypothetical protein